MERSGKVKAGLATTAVAGVLVVGAVIPATAQDDPPTPQEESNGHANRGAHADAFAAALADELGIDRARVDDALRNVRADLQEQLRERRLTALEERLADAVEDGDLTQEQAEAILEAAEDGVLPLGRHHDRRFRHFDGPGPDERPHGRTNDETGDTR
ncbi:MAG: hypothetical protein KY437_01720 [Actinobacteria bacterium]|nr:hypothetical protein [Actinomycetota bacterium]